MDAKELRIGNLLIDNLGEKYNYNGVESVVNIYDNTFDTLSVEYSENYKINAKSAVEPIPLTAEWLLGFGFEKRFSAYGAIGYLGYDYVVDDSFDVAVFNDGFYYDTSFHKINIKYVHQLQNLYFALVGEELTIK